MALKKQYLKTKPKCRVSFSFVEETLGKAEHVYLVGDFNNWDYYANPMKKQKDGSFRTILDLEMNKEYQFRYLINSDYWGNDIEADKYVATSFGDSENSVIKL